MCVCASYLIMTLHGNEMIKYAPFLSLNCIFKFTCVVIDLAFSPDSISSEVILTLKLASSLKAQILFIVSVALCHSSRQSTFPTLCTLSV